MKFDFNNTTAKSLLVLFIKVIICLAIISIIIKIFNLSISFLIGWAIGYGIFHGIKYLVTRKKGE